MIFQWLVYHSYCDHLIRWHWKRVTVNGQGKHERTGGVKEHTGSLLRHNNKITHEFFNDRIIRMKIRRSQQSTKIARQQCLHRDRVRRRLRINKCQCRGHYCRMSKYANYTQQNAILPFRDVPINWSSIARIWSVAVIFLFLLLFWLIYNNFVFFFVFFFVFDQIHTSTRTLTHARAIFF